MKLDTTEYHCTSPKAGAYNIQFKLNKNVQGLIRSESVSYLRDLYENLPIETRLYFCLGPELKTYWH